MATTRKAAKGKAVAKKEKKKGTATHAKRTAKTGSWAIAERPKQKTKAETIILASLAIGTVGVLGYLGWKHYRKNKGGSNDSIDEALKEIKTSTVPDIQVPKTDTTGIKTKRKKTSGQGAGTDEFPLSKGSKGEKVRQLQQALLAKYGNGVLPKYGADGDFGSETANALKKNGLPASIDESTFNVLVQAPAGADNSSDLAGKIYKAVSARNFTEVLSLLKTIQNKEQYQMVSNSFMKHRLRGVRQTLVNGILGSFSSNDQKQKIRLEFIRMGLQYNGNKWSLSGFEGKSIVTTEQAAVWVSPTQSIPVPANMVLGNEVTQRLDYTLFENNNRYFLVKTQSVKYL